MPQSLSRRYVRLAVSSKRISPLQGYELEGSTLTQAVGLGCDRSPLWGLRRTQMQALCLQVGEHGHAANKGDENVETPGPRRKPWVRGGLPSPPSPLPLGRERGAAGGVRAVRLTAYALGYFMAPRTGLLTRGRIVATYIANY